MNIQVDAQPAQTFMVEALPSAPKTFSVTADLSAGAHTVTIKCDTTSTSATAAPSENKK